MNGLIFLPIKIVHLATKKCALERNKKKQSEEPAENSTGSLRFAPRERSQKLVSQAITI